LDGNALLHHLASIKSSSRAARVVLALLVLFAMSAPLMHVHAAHDCSTETRSAAAGISVQADDHADQRPSGHPGHLAGGLDCCVCETLQDAAYSDGIAELYRTLRAPPS
jgi:hypothetical protein